MHLNNVKRVWNNSVLILHRYTIPNNIILKEILAPVLNEYLEDELTEDDFTSSNEPGQEGR